MADLTVIADVLHRAKPRGAIACPRRQAEPRAVLLLPCPRATTRGLLLAGRTKSRGHFAFSGAHDLFPDCLDCLRPSERNGTEM
jgi:hypothetical protein